LRRGQTAAWVILAVVLTAAVILFVLLQSDVGLPDILPGRAPPFSIDSYLSRCIASEVDKATKIMLPQGGFIEPTDFRIYNKSSVAYICKTSSYFEPCITQHPVLINEMEKEIADYISPGMDSCIRELAHEIENRGGTFVGSPEVNNLNVELDFERAIVSFDFLASIDEKGLKRDLQNFKAEIRSPLYNLGIVAQEIATQEASFCYFETVGYSLAYPRYKVIRKVLTDQSKIYIITDNKFKETMMVAVRSCALPEGMPG